MNRIKLAPGTYTVNLNHASVTMTVTAQGASIPGPFGIPITWRWWEIEGGWVLVPEFFALVTLAFYPDQTAVGIENRTGLGMAGSWSPV